MKKIVKNLGLSLGFGALAITAFAASLDQSIEQLNGVVAEILAGYQRADSAATVKFLTIKTDETRVLELTAIANYKRSGKTNTLEVNVANLSLNAGNVDLAGNIGLDFTKLFTQDQINDLIPGSEEMVKDLAKEYTRDYGAAATVDAKLLSTSKDEAGNYTGLTAELSAVIDLSKLPATKALADVPFTSAKAELALEATKGLTMVKLTVALNPAYKSYLDGAAVKAALERVLAGNPESRGVIDGWIKKIDDFASRIVDGQF